MTTLLPKDADNNVIPALRLRDGGAHTITTTVTAAANATPFNEGTKIISLYATQPIFVRFGDASVTATASDHYIPAGVYYDVAISSGGSKGPHYAYVSAIAASDHGILYISEKE